MGDASLVHSPDGGADREFDLVNREIDRHLDLWRHLDERMLGAAAPFLTLAAALVPASVLLSNTVDDPRRFYIACAPLLAFISVLGTVIALRVLNVGMQKKENLLHVAALRGYLTTRHPALATYLTPTADRAEIILQVGRMTKKTSSPVPVFSCVGASACLLGVVAALLVWWAWEDSGALSLAAAVIVGSIVGFLAELRLLRWRRLRSARGIANNLDVTNECAAFL